MYRDLPGCGEKMGHAVDHLLTTNDPASAPSFCATSLACRALDRLRAVIGGTLILRRPAIGCGVPQYGVFCLENVDYVASLTTVRTLQLAACVVELFGAGGLSRTIRQPIYSLDNRASLLHEGKLMTLTVKRLSWQLLMGVLIMANATSARAAIVNGDFSSGLTGWTPIGGVDFWDVPSSSGGVAVISSHGYQPGNFQINQAIQQTFTANAGDKLVFDWYGDFTAPAGTNVGIAVSITGVPYYPITLLENPMKLGPIPPTQTLSQPVTQYSVVLPAVAKNQYTVTIGTSGSTGQVGAGSYVFPQGTMYVDNVHIVPIPEPSSLVLGSLAFVGIAVAAVRCRRGRWSLLAVGRDGGNG